MIFTPTPPLWTKYVVLCQTMDTDTLFYYDSSDREYAHTKADNLWKGAGLMYVAVFDVGTREIIYERGLPLNRVEEP